MAKNDVVELTGDDGSTVSCRVLDVIVFGQTEYVLLLKLDADELAVMRYVERDNQAVFQTIEDDEEFEQVVAYIQALAEEK